MPLFNESLESIAQAIVTVKRALKEGVIEEENYKGLTNYLNQRAKDFKIKKSHMARAKKNLDDEMKVEVEEFFMEIGDSLYKWAEELLEEHEKNFGKDDDELLRAEQAKADDWDKQAAACKAFLYKLRQQGGRTSEAKRAARKAAVVAAW
jgi:hypothetical protein